MIKKLRRKNLIICLAFSAVIAVLAIFFGLMLAVDIYEQTKEVPNLSELTSDEIRAGMYIEGDVNIIWDYYSYTEKGGKMTAAEFFVPLKDGVYMCVQLEGKKMKNALENVDMLWDYLEDETGELTIDDLHTIHIRGEVEFLEGDSYKFFKEYVQEYDAEEQEYFKPYIIEKTESTGSIILFAILSIVLAVSSIVLFICGVTGSNVRQVKKYCRKKGSEEYTLSRINDFYDREAAVKGFRAGDGLFMAVKNNIVYIADADECLWCYRHVTRHYYNFIHTNNTYQIIMRKTDGKAITIPVLTNADCDIILEYIASKMPYLYFGYSDELEKAYKEQLSELSSAVAQRKYQYEMSTAGMQM